MRPGAINKTSQAEVTARLHETPNGRTMMISQDDNNDDDNRKSAHLVNFCSNAPQSFSNLQFIFILGGDAVFGEGDAFTQFLVSDPDFLSISSNGFPGFPLQMIYSLLSTFLTFIFHFLSGFISSVRSSSVYHGLLHTRSSSSTNFFKFFKFFRF